MKKSTIIELLIIILLTVVLVVLAKLTFSEINSKISNQSDSERNCRGFDKPQIIDTVKIVCMFSSGAGYNHLLSLDTKQEITAAEQKSRKQCNMNHNIPQRIAERLPE